MERTGEEQRVWEYIQGMDLDGCAWRLQLPLDDGGLGRDAAYVGRAIDRYRKWLFLAWKYEGILLHPLRDIDDVWHYHILDTRKYMRDSEAIFGCYKHHRPSWRMTNDEWYEVLAELETTKDLYMREFGEPFVTGIMLT